MADQVNEWVEKAVPAGSGRYYALLHSDSDIQQRQRLIATLISIFSKLGFQSREVEVVKHKLDWWRQELELDNFRHPVTDALGNISRSERQSLQRLLNGYGSLLESGSPSTDEQNYQFHLDTGGTACELLCSSNENTAVSLLGIALSKFRCLRYLRQHVDSGLLCIPMSSLDAAELSPALLTPAASTEAVESFLLKELSTVKQEMQESSQVLEEFVTGITNEERHSFKALYVYHTLQQKLLQSMLRDKVSVVTEATRLTPIRYYWHAFRAARKFDKLG